MIADVERRVVNLKEDKKVAVLERLELARTLADTGDALGWHSSRKTPQERNK